jgi:glycosyltransferase involved in cell wall biosynthesis
MAAKTSMRILQLKTSSGVGGAETTLVALTKGIIERGHDVYTVFGEHGQLVGRFHAEGLPFLVIEGARSLVPAAAFRLWRVMRAQTPDVVLAHGARMNALAAGPAAVCGIPTIGVEHNIDGWRTMGKVRKRVDRIIARTNVGRVTVADAVSRMLIDEGILPASRVRTVPNLLYRPPLDTPLDRLAVRKEFAIGEDQLGIAVVARLAEQKGHATLLLAATKMECLDRVRFVFFGEGPLRDSLEATARELGVERAVVFAGARSGVTALLPAFDMFVLPSLWEGLPIAVLEAMAVGLAVVATAVAATPEIVKDGVTGLLVPPDDSDALSAAICRLVSDDHLRNRLARAGQTLRQHGSDRNADWVDTYLAAIRELMGEPRAVQGHAARIV